ncbi:MAG: DUF7694 domain-containing protein [Alphaproteobacteria bacterium]
MSKISELRRELKAKNSEATRHLELVPKDEWPLQLERGREPLRVWRSRYFLVQEYEESGYIRISVVDSRTLKSFSNNSPKFGGSITWDELQQIKRDIGYGDKCAVEVFPPDNLVVNIANMRHLWVLDYVPNFCWGGKNAKNAD